VAILYLGGVTGVVALVLAFYAGGTVRRTALLVGLGLALASGWLLVVYFSSPSGDRPTGCSDCGVHLGRWLDLAAIMVVGGGNVIAWILGVLVGSAARAAMNPRAITGGTASAS